MFTIASFDYHQVISLSATEENSKKIITAQIEVLYNHHNFMIKS